MLRRANAGWRLRDLIHLLLLAACSDGAGQRGAFVDAGERVDASAVMDANHPEVSDEVGPGFESEAGPPIPALTCGDSVCASWQPSLAERVIAAGCALDYQDAEVCGLAAPDPAARVDGSVPAFLPKDAPGTPSTSCGAFLESQLERPTRVDSADAGYPNAQIDVRGFIVPDGMPLEIVRVYPGCCTPLGACGVDSRNGLVIHRFGRLSYNAGYGCIEPRAFFATSTAGLQSAHCDPQSGLIVPPPDAGMDGGRDGGPSDAAVADADAGNG